MTPDSENIIIDMYEDAEFAGLYTTKDKMDHVSVKSKSGVLLTFGNVPILWSSKLQTKKKYIHARSRVCCSFSMYERFGVSKKTHGRTW